MSDQYTPDDLWLCDNGTLDTVVEYTCRDCGKTHTLRYSDTARWRSPITGGLMARMFYHDVVIPDIESDGCPEFSDDCSFIDCRKEI